MVFPGYRTGSIQVILSNIINHRFHSSYYCNFILSSLQSFGVRITVRVRVGKFYKIIIKFTLKVKNLF
jgi:hypothetical protein